jgi:hypothetical protein
MFVRSFRELALDAPANGGIRELLIRQGRAVPDCKAALFRDRIQNNVAIGQVCSKRAFVAVPPEFLGKETREVELPDALFNGGSIEGHRYIWVTLTPWNK